MLPVCVIVLSVVASSGTSQGVLLDFTATWCGPCQEMSPLVSRLEREGYPIRKVDVDKERELAQRFKVTGIPAFVLVVNGREVSRVVGKTSETTLKQMMAKIPTAPAASNSSQPLANTNTSTAPRRSTLEAPAPVRTSTPVTLTSETPKSGGLRLPFLPKREDRAPRVISEPAAPPVLRAKLEDQPLPQDTPPGRHDPLSSSVRIRVNDSQGENFGSGTLISSQVGRSIIVTCAHVFRNVDKNGKVEVDLFVGSGDDQVETYVGKVIRYDLESDVGLIAINNDAPLPVCPVAPANYQVLKGTPVISVGCGGGEPPTVQQLRVTALNRYLGPDNLECSGLPVQGRSGGGLFSRDGQVIGICTAADPRDQRGLYAGLKAIQPLLDESNLTALYRGNAAATPAALTQAPQAQTEMQFVSAPAAAPRRRATRAAAPQMNSAPASIDLGAEGSMETNAAPVAFRAQNDDVELESSELFADQQAASETEPMLDDASAESLRRTLEQVGHAEVVCVVRPINQPQEATRVIVINRASPRFVSYLTGELASQEAVQPTSGVRRTASVSSGSAAESTRYEARLQEIELPAVSSISRHQPAVRTVKSTKPAPSRQPVSARYSPLDEETHRPPQAYRRPQSKSASASNEQAS